MVAAMPIDGYADFEGLIHFGGRRDAPVKYWTEREVPDPQRMWCPDCDKGRLALEPDPNRRGDMYTCYGGCGQRFWIDFA